MKKEEIAVMAGTPVDTDFGCQLLEGQGFLPLPCPISDDPAGQTYFQTLPVGEKTHQVEEILLELKGRGVKRVLIYCNSLSASIDFDQLAKDLRISLVTPFQAYQDLARQGGSYGVMAANAQGAAGVERAMVQENPGIGLVSIGNLAWVQAVEAGEAPQVLVQKYGIPQTLQLFQKMDCDSLVLACTHFPYFLAALEATSPIPIINPDDFMLEALLQAGG